MRVPTRKPGKYAHLKQDAHITQQKHEELKGEMERLKKFRRPRVIAEVQRLAADGDFSENAAYQIAKGRLRGINRRIDEIEDILRRVEIIAEPTGSDRVGLGSSVTVCIRGKEKKFLILGSAETDPSRGIISHNSPIGQALIGKRVGDKAKVSLPDREVVYEILKIE